MSDTKHTPGPWRVVWATEDQTLSIVAGENAGTYSETIIAEIGGLFGHCEEANARLIAAAPMLRDLLEVLSGGGSPQPFAEAMGVWATKYGLSLTEGVSLPTLRSWAIETAIAKAGGK